MPNAINVMLGPLYEPNMWDLRKEIAASRSNARRLAFVDVRVPVTSDVVGLAIRTDDLYLIGIRNGAGAWFEFKADTERSNPASGGSAKPLVSGSQWIKVGSLNALSSYTALQLPALISNAVPRHATNRYDSPPTELLKFFSRWNGTINDNFTRLRICVLIFVICEALRFRSIQETARNWISPLHPPPTGPAFEITAEMLNLVRSWAEKAKSSHADVQTWLPGMRDLLVE